MRYYYLHFADDKTEIKGLAQSHAASERQSSTSVLPECLLLSTSGQAVASPYLAFLCKAEKGISSLRHFTTITIKSLIHIFKLIMTTAWTVPPNAVWSNLHNDMGSPASQAVPGPQPPQEESTIEEGHSMRNSSRRARRLVGAPKPTWRMKYC